MTASKWTDAYLVFTFICVWAFGWFASQAYYRDKDAMLKVWFKCCDHCFDPTTGETMHAREVMERHPTPCNEDNCVKGRQAIV